MNTRISAAAIALLTITTLFAAAVPVMADRGGIKPMPGETPLTKAQKAEALAHMPPAERVKKEKLWADPNNLPVSFVQAYYRIEKDTNGKEKPVRVDTAPGRLKDAPNFHVANLDSASAATSSSETTSLMGTARKYDLYISNTVTRTSCSGCYQWAVESYADWQGTSGMDCCNRKEDSIGSSWTDNLSMHHDAFGGKWSKSGVTTTNIDIWRSEYTPAEGVGWSFHEYRPNYPIPVPTNYAYGIAYLREGTWKNDGADTGMKYVHTNNDASSISLSFLNASISVSGGGDNKWTLAAYSHFTH